MSIKYVHTNIISDNWERLAEFYQEVFGCKPVPPHRDQSGPWLEQGTGVKDAHVRGVHLRLPGCGDDGPTLEIYQYDKMEEKPQAAANRKGLCHIAFQVDDVAATRQSVLDHGGKDLGQITKVEVPGVGRLTFIYMADPEDNIVEIQEWS